MNDSSWLSSFVHSSEIMLRRSRKNATQGNIKSIYICQKIYLYLSGIVSLNVFVKWAPQYSLSSNLIVWSKQLHRAKYFTTAKRSRYFIRCSGADFFLAAFSACEIWCCHIWRQLWQIVLKISQKKQLQNKPWEHHHNKQTLLCNTYMEEKYLMFFLGKT